MKSITLSLFNIWLRLSSLICFVVVLFIFLFIAIEAKDFILQANWLEVFTSSLWYPSENQYGILALLSGSIMVSVLALCLALPMAFFSSFAIVFYLQKSVADLLQAFIECLSGTPSVVIGLFGLMQLIPFLAEYVSPAYGLFAAAIVLSFLLIPSLIVNLLEIFKLEIQDSLLVAQSLQISKSNFILKILLPSKKKAIKNAIVLISGKAFGETLAVLMVAGNIIAVPKALFESFRTINANIALEMPYALGIHRSALFFLGLLSFIIILFFSLLSSRQEKE